MTAYTYECDNCGQQWHIFSVSDLKDDLSIHCPACGHRNDGTSRAVQRHELKHKGTA